MPPVPGLTLVTARRLVPLLQHVAGQMAADPLPPLEREIIVVQSQGMRRWLTLQLADLQGCSGSIDMPFPASFMRDLAARLGAGVPPRGDDDPFSREVLAWRIDALLRALPDEAVYAPLLSYVRGADERARFGLASRLASRLDDYQLYRNDLLADWEAGRDTPGTPHARWQAALWRTLCAEAGQGAQHAGARLQRALDLLEEAGPRGIRRVTVFGVSTLPPLFIELLATLALHVPVTICTASVTPPVSHPLAAGFDRQAREFATMLQLHGATRIELPDEAPRTGTLLGRLQQEIASGDEGIAPITLRPDDASLRIHSAHGAVRQLEIVRDQLLDAMAADATLRPHDLLLLVPDAGVWAPWVDAVFGVADPEHARIPYRIADRPARGDDPAAEVLGMLLDLQGSRLNHSEVFELLARPLVHESAGLAESQVDALRVLTARANVRWGYDATSRMSLGLPRYEEASWRASLDRLLLGMTTGRTDDVVLGVLPYAGDTTGDRDGIARLATWVDRLAELLGGWATPRPLLAWADAMREAVEFVMGAAMERDAQSAQSVLALLQLLDEVADGAAYDEVVPFGVVRDWLEQELDGEGRGGGFLGGGMTVAALKPMRSLPFRVIAVLGLDEGVFPRRDRRTAFDMLEHEHRPGDRDLRTDDRQLFLDLFMAAGDRLVLAYNGRDVGDNSPRASSVVLDEVLDHLDRRSAGTARAIVRVEHPLQPFSHAYFAAGRDPRLFTFSTAHARTALASGQARAAEPPFVPAPLVPPPRAANSTFELTISELADAWCNPARHFCRTALGFTLGFDEDEASDDEILMPDALEQGTIRNDMLKVALGGAADADRNIRLLQAGGALPPGVLGTAWGAALHASVQAVVSMLPVGEVSRPVPLVVSHDDWCITGTLDGVRGTVRYVTRAGQFRALHDIRAWIEHIVMCAAAQQHPGRDIPQHSVLLGVKDGQGKEFDRFAPVPEAVTLLAGLVEVAREARTVPVPFFAQAASAWLGAHVANAKARRNATYKDPQQQAMAAYHAEGAFGNPAGDHAEPHVALCFRGQDPLDEHWDEFEVLVTQLFGLRVPGGVQP